MYSYPAQKKKKEKSYTQISNHTVIAIFIPLKGRTLCNSAGYNI
jgi:hypothetical protein